MCDGASPSSKRQKIAAGQLYDNKHEFEQRSVVFSPQYPARVFKLMEVCYHSCDSWFMFHVLGACFVYRFQMIL